MYDRLKHIAPLNNALRRPPVLYARAIRTLKAVSCMSAEMRARWQDRQIARVLAAARSLPGYRQNPGSGTLPSWPVMSKQQMLGAEAGFRNTGIMPLVPASTGGTTGQPMRLKRSIRAIAFEQAMIDWYCARAGLDLRSARTAVLRGDSIVPAGRVAPPFWVDEGPARRIFSAHHIAPATGSAYAQALRAFAPDVLFCYPSSLASLLAAISGEDIRIPFIFCSSEMLDTPTLEAARARLGARVIDFYGHAERLVAAFSIDGQDWRFVPAYGHIELLPDSDGLARIIATSLRTDGQIFVRYDTGDLARVPSHDPAVLRDIALGVAPFGGIEGRSSECVDLPGGRRIIGLNHIPRDVTGTASVQLFQSSPSIMDIFIVPAAPGALPDTGQLTANFRAKFPAEICAHMHLVARPVREPNGKAPLLLRKPQAPEFVCRDFRVLPARTMTTSSAA